MQRLFENKIKTDSNDSRSSIFAKYQLINIIFAKFFHFYYIMYTIIRNNQTFGPFSLEALKNAVEDGKLLKNDKLFENEDSSHITTVRKVLIQNKIKVNVKNNGSILSQLHVIGRELLLPKDLLKKDTWANDRRLLLLALVGLCPLLLTFIIANDFLTFYSISLYFSTIWGIFFYNFFKTKQVKLSTTIKVFFLTQVFVFLIWGFGLNNINLFYYFHDSSSLTMKMVFFIFAVGVTEEFAKTISLLIIAGRSREVLIPHTLVFYGLMSGVAFGVFEGVQYQMGVNQEFGYSQSFFMNIARLTSLPFLHAIWRAIAGYFVGFAHIYPKYRRSLYFLAIVIPALLHGIYDTFCGTLGGMLIALPVTFFAVALLMCYLKNDTNYQQKLKG